MALRKRLLSFFLIPALLTGLLTGVFAEAEEETPPYTPPLVVDEHTTAEDLAAVFPDVAGKTIEGLMASFMDKWSLDGNNFSLCYYNTVTGEEYSYNETNFMVAASTYKLPLNLYYYELEAAGEITGDTIITEGGASLAYCHQESLVNSNNELSMAMLYRLGNFATYKEDMRKYFTMADEEIDPKYYWDNYYCTRMMMDCLKYLYAHAGEQAEMIGYLEKACPGAYFKTYLEDKVTVAHKYGSFEGAENDTGIIYASQPFLLAVYTQDVGELAVAEAAQLLYDYTEYQYACSELGRIAAEKEEAARLAAEQEEAEAERLAAEQAEAERLAAEREEAERLSAEQEEAARLAARQEETERLTDGQDAAQQDAFEWWMIAVALGVFFTGGGTVLLCLRRGRKYQGKFVKK